VGRSEHHGRGACVFGVARLLNGFSRGKRFDSRNYTLTAADFFANNFDTTNALFASERRALARTRVTHNPRNSVGFCLMANQFAQASLIEITAIFEGRDIRAENAG
jgi:hypothetical protein